MKILVVDDDLVTRNILKKILEGWNYHVLTAEDGGSALALFEEHQINFVITDWMMPGINGLQLCEQIRGMNLAHYVFIVLLTSRDDKEALLEGLKSGADEFIIKPFNKEELRYRIRTGERIYNLKKTLDEQTQNLLRAYEVIERDLKAAAHIQNSLLPDKQSQKIANYSFESLFIPSSFIAGDIYNYFRLDEAHLGFYLLDVAGHGIPASMLSMTLSKFISPDLSEFTLLTQKSGIPPRTVICSPEKVVSDLNRNFQSRAEILQYFTIVYGIIELKSGKVLFTQAGHPSPVIKKKNNQTSLIGKGGFPVGMFDDVEFEAEEIVLEAGDTLFIYSDGITECTNSAGEIFSEQLLMENLSTSDSISSLPALEKKLKAWNGSGNFSDDISMLAITRVN